LPERSGDIQKYNGLKPLQSTLSAITTPVTHLIDAPPAHPALISIPVRPIECLLYQLLAITPFSFAIGHLPLAIPECFGAGASPVPVGSHTAGARRHAAA
jgi:hypothetical protein